MRRTNYPSTIDVKEFLPVRTVRFEGLARQLFQLVVSSHRLNGVGTLHLIETWDGHRRVKDIGDGALRADLIVRDPRAYAAMVFGGSKGLGRSYVNGWWDSNDVTTMVRMLFRATDPTRRLLDWVAQRAGFLWLLGHRVRPSKVQDRENIHAHYDLSNEFFSHMLDESMGYSCAIFADDSTSLHEAQVEKFDRICRKLDLGPDDHVVEIGTGWGGFALHAAGRYGARVTTTTISQNQRRAAEERVRDAGLDHLITVRGDHYEDLTGSYDALVSIEMIEAVSWRKYDEFFAKCSSLLNDRGRMALQAITIAERSFPRAKRHDDFIRDLIFPGGCLTSVSAIMDSVARVTDLSAVDLEDIGRHYARTLSLWRTRVREQNAAMTDLGFDERFLRLWDLYLCYCEGAFLERHISDIQLVLHKPHAPSPLGYSKR